MRRMHRSRLRSVERAKWSLGLIVDRRMLALGSMSDARFRDLQSSLNILDINFRELISL